MIEFLIMQIRLGRIGISQVPEKFRDQVQTILSLEQ